MIEASSAPLGVAPDVLDADPLPQASPAPAATQVTDLAAHLAARLCHDFISPASAIMSGVDLLGDPTAQDMRDDALNLISASARKLGDMLAFARVAFGAAAPAAGRHWEGHSTDSELGQSSESSETEPYTGSESHCQSRCIKFVQNLETKPAGARESDAGNSLRQLTSQRSLPGF